MTLKSRLSSFSSHEKRKDLKQYPHVLYSPVKGFNCSFFCVLVLVMLIVKSANVKPWRLPILRNSRKSQMVGTKY